ncbi:glycosyltransferase family 4 protein [Clostridium estertheticum]|uniref:glycosyltransferase family 4 protein n=1 Tax=Clostridium estertheticum TaxID=238834 RepID=UPI0013EE949A|nr:glycosyltransferase family 4 protein [Clostridium estertheticum]MBZ9609371.1 glycosyltransferase family 4 protein [Clostridium estertheticum]
MSPEKKKKILMIGPFPDPITGMSVSNQMLLAGLLENGHEVEFIDSNAERTFTSLKAQGKFSIKKILNSVRPIAIGCYKILFQKFDVVYITPAQSYLGFLKYTPFINVANFKKTKCYIEFHGGFVRVMYDSVDAKKQKALTSYFNKTDGVIVLGESLRSMFDGILEKNKVFVCENGVQDEYMLTEKEFAQKLQKNQQLNNNCKMEELKILYLSNLMQSKGILDLLKACIKLKKENFKFHLNLAGNIEAEIVNTVNEMSKELGGHVTYHGVVKGDKKSALLKDNHVFCLPTYYPNEGQPISILEAMGNGLAIITTTQGGIIDIFKDGENGAECNKKDPDSICEAMKKCNENYIKYSKKNYYECLAEYNRKAFVGRIENIILK